MSLLLLLSIALLVAGAIGVLVLHVRSALIPSLAIASAVFAGNTRYLGFPIPPDRILMALGLFLLLVGTERSALPMRLRFRSQHLLMMVLAVYATISSLVAGTLFSAAGGQYALLDRLSITAFVLFSVAPIAFHDKVSRNQFLGVIVALGFYLGVTACLEGVGLKAAAWPRYINDPNVGLHFDRARGPMTESGGFGLALFECAVTAVLASRVWSARPARAFAWLVTALCLAGTLFTLTRAVWIGAGLGVLLVMVISAEWRRRLLPVVAVGGVALFLALSLSSSLSGQVDERSGDQRPVWDRLNLVDAGLRAVEEKPVFGVGWRHFIGVSPEYFRLLPDIPQTGTTIDIHNAVLSVAAELGLVGAIMWVGAIASTVGAACVWRPPPGMEDWRVALVAMTAQWIVVAMLTPFAYTFSMFFMFTFAGIVAAPRFVQPRRRVLVGGRRAPAAAAPVLEGPVAER